MLTLPTYVLVTPARNEAAFIELTIQSVVAQTVRPVRWAIVSDGSTDGTDDIVKKYAADFPWIELIRMPEYRDRHFAGKVHAFNAGYARLVDVHHDVIGNLDGDVSFDSDYFSFLLGKLAEYPGLGVVGTAFKDDSGMTYDYRFTSIEHATGICQVFRRQCFEEIGGYVPAKGGAVDSIAVITARMKGWKTRTFTEKICLHHRAFGTAEHSALMARFNYGAKDYAVGNHPIWELFRTVYQMTKTPFFFGGLMLASGYLWSFLRQTERPVSRELMAFLRREQMKRLKTFFATTPTRSHLKFPIRTLDPMTHLTKHITVCICTYRRSQLLKPLLERLGKQETGGLFSFSIVVSDNDKLRSAESIVTSFNANSSVPVKYCAESRQNIALARNKAIENATGDFVAFIDDDELPAVDWLITLFKTCTEYDADGALGPVKPFFEKGTPKWIVKGNFYTRPSYPTGLVIDWRKGRTGNVLLKSEMFMPEEEPFRPEFRVGEDQEFFRRMIEKGRVFVWCDEAAVYESVPPMRWKRTFMLKRALLRGRMSLLHPTFGVRDIAISLIAVPAYSLALPAALLFGQAVFMSLAVRLCDHAGRLLALVGINPISEPYVTG